MPVVTWMNCAPTWRATVETVVTLFVFAAAWLVRAQFGDSRLVRDVVLFGALLTLAVTNFCVYTVPVALGLRTPGTFAAAGFIAELLVAKGAKK